MITVCHPLQISHHNPAQFPTWIYHNLWIVTVVSPLRTHAHRKNTICEPTRCALKKRIINESSRIIRILFQRSTWDRISNRFRNNIHQRNRTINLQKKWKQEILSKYQAIWIILDQLKTILPNRWSNARKERSKPKRRKRIREGLP